MLETHLNSPEALKQIEAGLNSQVEHKESYMLGVYEASYADLWRNYGELSSLVQALFPGAGGSHISAVVHLRGKVARAAVQASTAKT